MGGWGRERGDKLQISVHSTRMRECFAQWRKCALAEATPSLSRKEQNNDLLSRGVFRDDGFVNVCCRRPHRLLLRLFNLEWQQQETWARALTFFVLSEVKSSRSCLTSVGGACCHMKATCRILTDRRFWDHQGREACWFLSRMAPRVEPSGMLASKCAVRSSAAKGLKFHIKCRPFEIDVRLERDSLSSSFQPKMLW